MSLQKTNRTLHRWGSVLIFLPFALVLVTGVLLLLKRDVTWIQPETMRGSSTELAIGFERILEIAKAVPEAEIDSWDDINRLDIRPAKGVVKVRANSSWEIQIDTKTGEVLQVAYRRSDFIESLHDGTFFHDRARLWIFLPSAIVLMGMWVTGVYLFLLPHRARRKRRQRLADSE
jgi:uncharacterized iron-regulated membrane protein